MKKKEKKSPNDSGSTHIPHDRKCHECTKIKSTQRCLSVNANKYACKLIKKIVTQLNEDNDNYNCFIF